MRERENGSCARGISVINFLKKLVSAKQGPCFFFKWTWMSYFLKSLGLKKG